MSVCWCQRESQAMATKRQSVDYRERAQAKAVERQCADSGRENLRLWLTTGKEKPSLKLSSEFKESEAQAKKQWLIRQSSTPCRIVQASQAFIMATKEGTDYTCVCCNRLMYGKTVRVQDLQVQQSTSGVHHTWFWNQTLDLQNMWPCIEAEKVASSS